MIKLFVDDLRACPEGWVPARTISEAIRLLATQNVAEVSLDHDIICSCPDNKRGSFEHNHNTNESFEPVAWFVAVYNSLRTDGLIRARIHTSNYDAAKRMCKILGMEYISYVYNEADYR